MRQQEMEVRQLGATVKQQEMEVRQIGANSETAGDGAETDRSQ